LLSLKSFVISSSHRTNLYTHTHPRIRR